MICAVTEPIKLRIRLQTVYSTIVDIQVFLTSESMTIPVPPELYKWGRPSRMWFALSFEADEHRAPDMTPYMIEMNTVI